MEQGWDPDIKRFFLKILNSICFGLLWLLACATAGIYYGLAYTSGKPLIDTVLFYAGMGGTLFLLLRYYYHTWKSRP
jgi:hypothetical protein